MFIMHTRTHHTHEPRANWHHGLGDRACQVVHIVHAHIHSYFQIMDALVRPGELSGGKISRHFNNYAIIPTIG